MTVSLVALVGADANIGSENDLPVFADISERNRQAQWFDALSVGSIIVMGSNTIRIMERLGFQGVDDKRKLVPWTRDHGQTPEEFLEALQAERRHVIIAGEATTFRLFSPVLRQLLPAPRGPYQPAGLQAGPHLLVVAISAHCCRGRKDSSAFLNWRKPCCRKTRKTLGRHFTLPRARPLKTRRAIPPEGWATC
jgi:hypothetical protein